MNPAPCSWRVIIKRMLEFVNEFSKSRFSSPGTPKMYWTPSFSNAFTNKSDAFISFARDTPSIRLGRDSVSPSGGPGLAFSVLVECYLRLLIAAIPVVAMLAFPTAKREGKVMVTDPVKAGALMECAAEAHGNGSFPGFSGVCRDANVTSGPLLKGRPAMRKTHFSISSFGTSWLPCNE